MHTTAKKRNIFFFTCESCAKTDLGFCGKRRSCFFWIFLYSPEVFFDIYTRMQMKIFPAKCTFRQLFLYLPNPIFDI